MILLLKQWRLILCITIALLATYFGYRAGLNSITVDQLATLEAYQAQNRELAAELEAEKTNIKIKTIETVRMLEREQDPTGCLDTTIPDGVLSSLSHSSGGRIPND